MRTTSTPDTSFDYVGIGEAARLMSLSRTSMQKLVDAGVVSAIKTVGGHRRILRSSLMLKVPANQVLFTQPGPRMGRRQDDAKYAKSLSPQRANSLSVLIVEDDVATAALLEATLAAYAPQLVTMTAADGLDAVLLLERSRPDILITDLNMQPFDGFKLIQLVTARSEYKHILLIVISGLTAHEIEARGGLPPNVLFFSKPIDLSRLRGFADAHLQLLQRQLATE
jgi:excisionase family DNA binding protein